MPASIQVGNSGTIDDGMLREIVRRIVEVARPDKIILFGSAARGSMRPESDVDLLIVKAGAHRLETAQELYRHFWGIPVSLDLVVATPEDLAEHGTEVGMIYAPALRDGRVIYAA